MTQNIVESGAARADDAYGTGLLAYQDRENRNTNNCDHDGNAACDDSICHGMRPKTLFAAGLVLIAEIASIIFTIKNLN